MTGLPTADLSAGTPKEEKVLRKDQDARAEGFLSLLEPLPLGLAPMAGFTTAPFRTIAARMGASFTVTELVSARGIRHDPTLKRSARYLVPSGGDKPWGIQLFGQDPEDFVYAITRLYEEPLYRSASFIDLNMGCPAPKVLREGAGCSLMRDPKLVERVVKAAVNTASDFGWPVTAKIRSGVSPDTINACLIARVIEAAGASALTIHARTLDQYYKGQADWKIIRQVKESVSIPVIGNGDLALPGDLEKMREATGCDGFMVGRAARGNPFIFDLLRGQAMEITTGSWLKVMLEHLDATIEMLGEEVAIREMRSHFAFYLRGFEDSARFRRQVMEPVSREGVVRVLHQAAKRRDDSYLLY